MAVDRLTVVRVGGASAGPHPDLTLLSDLTNNIFSVYNASYVDVSYLQRETAYVMRNEIDAISLGINNTYLGQPASFVRDYAEDHVLGHIDQMCLTQNAQYYEFFMTGLEAEALVQYWNTTSHDPRIPPALACLANWMYTNYWQHNDTGAFSLRQDRASNRRNLR